MVKGKQRISVYIDNSMKEGLLKYSNKMGLSMNGFINVCIENYIHQRETIEASQLAQQLLIMQQAQMNLEEDATRQE